jgi:tetratricopeptide (TPR) repeat protein
MNTYLPRILLSTLFMLMSILSYSLPYDSLHLEHLKIARYISSSQMSLDIGKLNQAELLAQEAVVLAESQVNEKVKADAYTNLGLTYFKTGKDIGSKKYLSKAIKIYYSLESVPLEAIFAIKSLSSLIKESDIYVAAGTSLPNNANNFNLTSNQFSRHYDNITLLNYTQAKEILESSVEVGDKEIEARAYINLGLVLSKNTLDKNLMSLFESVSYLQKGLDIYYSNKIKSPEIKIAEQQLMDYNIKYKNLVPQEGLYAGIEVGSKGVKLSVINLGSDIAGEYYYKIEKDTAINTEIISFTDFAIKETISAVKKLYNQSIKKYGIKNSHIFIAISSGVQSEADKKSKLPILSSLQKSIQNEIGDATRHIEVITPELEARLVHVGVIHQDGRYDGVIVDIGSGNTKGGFFDSSLQNFEPFSIRIGTKSLANEVDKDGFSDIKLYATAVRERMLSITNGEIRPLISSKSSLRNRKNIIFSGGISWAIASIMHPEQINRAYASFSSSDITNFKYLAINKYEELINPERLMYNVKQEDQERAKLEIRKVFDVFDQKALIAGAELAESLTKEFSTGVPKNFFFARFGYIGWITGYIIKSQGAEN